MMYFVMVILIALIGLVAYLFHHFRQERDSALASMSPDQREHFEADREYRAAVVRAEQYYGNAVNGYERSVKAAQKDLQLAKEQGRQRVGTQKTRNGDVRLWQDRIETPQGTHYFQDGRVKAKATSKGTLRVMKERTVDTRELYLRVETPAFISQLQCNPDHSTAVRQFEVAVINASHAAASMRQGREHAMTRAAAGLATAYEDRGCGAEDCGCARQYATA